MGNLISLAGCGSPEEAEIAFSSDKHVLKASLDRRVDELFEDQQSQAIALGVYKDDRSYAKVYGVVGEGAELPPDANTVFQIGSISKIFTASLLQALVDQGVVSMDATLGELLVNSVELSDKAAAITLRQLVTHTSGFPRVPDSLLSLVEQRAGALEIMLDPYSHLTTDEIFAYLADSEGTKSPGNFDYSNYGMGLLGHVLEKIMSESLEQLYETHLFKPMKMENTSIELSTANKGLLAQGHTDKGEPTGPWHFDALAGAGALNSNTNDMLTFLKVSLDQGSDANKRLEAMRVPQYNVATGIGWLQATPTDRKLGLKGYVWHTGMTGGFSSYIAMNPDDQTGIVVLTNRAIDLTKVGRKLTRVLISQSWSD